ncbi:MAG: DUF1015 domain-containing protein [Candidatus Omnitrophota bacterium]
MSKIKPFKSLLYDGSKIGGDYASVMAPPYDVISERKRDELYEKSEYGIIRLILGRSFPGDDDGDNRYTRARKDMDEWCREGILARDDVASFYVYLQEYDFKGIRRRRIGFLGLMKIGEAGDDTVKPHEFTLAKPKADRMNLIQQVESNLSPIFTLYEDRTGVITEILNKHISAASPIVDITIDGESHKVWRIRDKASIRKISDPMAREKVFIADGHHRYEVARAYRDMKRQEPGYDGSADYVMMYFADMLDKENLTVMATHRVVKIMPEADESKIAEKLGGYFDVCGSCSMPGLMEKLEGRGEEGYTFGFFGGGKYFCLTAKDKNEVMGLIKEDKSPEWKMLDVSMLHSAVFRNILSICNDEGNITYVRDAEEAEALVRDGSHMAAFLMNPTRVEQIKAVAELGEMMPQKSTYFYPKLLTGLVINKFEKKTLVEAGLVGALNDAEEKDS